MSEVRTMMYYAGKVGVLAGATIIPRRPPNPKANKGFRLTQGQRTILDKTQAQYGNYCIRTIQNPAVERL